jgi:hypothetical protein
MSLDYLRLYSDDKRCHSDEYVEYKRIEGGKKHRTSNAKQKKCLLKRKDF